MHWKKCHEELGTVREFHSTWKLVTLSVLSVVYIIGTVTASELANTDMC